MAQRNLSTDEYYKKVDEIHNKYDWYLDRINEEMYYLTNVEVEKKQISFSDWKEEQGRYE